MAFNGRLELTDGITTIDLLGHFGGPFGLLEWEPAAPGIKESGIWMDNPLINGRQLAIASETNITDTFRLSVRGQSQADVWKAVSNLRIMADKAKTYWTHRSLYRSPVYLLIQYPEETEPLQAIVYNVLLSPMDNPYARPVRGRGRSVIPEFTLVIEHGLRYKSSGSECADLQITYNMIPLGSMGDYVPAASSDDATVYWTAGNLLAPNSFILTDVATTIVTYPYLGFPDASTGEIWYTCRVNNVTIPQGSVIRKAYIELLGQKSNPVRFFVSLESDMNPATYSTWNNFLGRAFSSWIELNQEDIDPTWVLTSRSRLTNAGGLETFVQNLVSNVAWASGNAMAFRIRNPDNYPYAAAVVCYDSGANFPELHIEYEYQPKQFAMSNKICSDIVLGNKRPYNTIGDIQVYDASGPTYSNRKGTALPWTLLPAVPAVGDMIYFACNYILARPFSSLVFNLSQSIGAGSILVWEYYTGAAWVSVSAYDNTSNLINLGINSVAWNIPANWAANAVNGITAYWIRARVTSVGTSTPIQSTNEVYASFPPFIDLDEVQFGGYPTRFKLSVDPVGSPGNDSQLSIDDVIVAIRSKDRGEDFSPFINLVDEAQFVSPGISFSHPVGTDTQLNSAPTGRAIRYNPGAGVAEADWIVVSMFSDIASQYAGKFRVFLRRYGTTDPENLSYRLKVSVESSGLSSAYFQTSLIPDTANPSHSLIDFGVIDLTSFADDFNRFILTISGVVSAAADVYWEDLILIPVDEAMYRASQNLGDEIDVVMEGFNTRSTVFDSITNDLEQVYMEQGTNQIVPFILESNAPLRLYNHLNPELRVWFLFGCYTSDSVNYQRIYDPAIIAAVTLRVLPEYV